MNNHVANSKLIFYLLSDFVGGRLLFLLIYLKIKAPIEKGPICIFSEKVGMRTKRGICKSEAIKDWPVWTIGI